MFVHTDLALLISKLRAWNSCFVGFLDGFVGLFAFLVSGGMVGCLVGWFYIASAAYYINTKHHCPFTKHTTHSGGLKVDVSYTESIT